MKPTHREFRETTIFDWDNEPADERSHSTFEASNLAPLHERRPSRNNKTLRLTVFVVIALLAVGVVAMLDLAKFMRLGRVF